MVQFFLRTKEKLLGGVPHVMMTGDTGGTGVYRSKQVNAHNHFGGDSLKPAHVDYVPALCTHRLSCTD